MRQAAPFDDPPRHAEAAIERPANGNSTAPRRPRPDAWQRIVAAASRFDDGEVLRWFFRSILVGAAIVLALDLHQIRQSEALTWEESEAVELPVLPPSLSDGAPEAPPFEITTDPQTLKQPVRFDLLADGVMRLQGAIDAGAADRFASEVEARGEYIRTIELNSPGGSVDDALRISSLIRERGFETRVANGGLCASSCPIVLAGGTARHADEEAVIGVHQVYGVGTTLPSPAHAMAAAQSTTARVSRHLTEMGIGQGLWLHALETAPDRLYYLSQDEMAEYALTTTSEADRAR